MSKQTIMRLVSLGTVLVIVIVFLVWNAGVISLPFLPSPLPAETTGQSETTVGETSAITTVSPETTDPPATAPPETTSPPVTSPPETEKPEARFPDASELAALGYVKTALAYDPATMVIAKAAVASEIATLSPDIGTKTVYVKARFDTADKGIVIRTVEETVTVTSLVPYMGYVIAYAGEKTYLLDGEGNIMRDDLPESSFTYRDDAKGRPIFKLESGYYALKEDGVLTSVSYTPVKYEIKADREAPWTDPTRVPYSERLPIFYLFDPEEDDEPTDGTILYTEKQKEAIEGGMSPEEALSAFPRFPETAAPETTMPETSAPETTEEETTAPEIEPQPDPDPEPEVTEGETTAPEIEPESEGDPQPEGTAGETTERAAQEGEIEPSMTDATAEPNETESETTETEPETEPETTETEPETTETEPETTEPETTIPETESPEPEVLYFMYYEMRWGYKNEDGDVVISPRFTYAFPFGENGMAAVTMYNDILETSALAFINRSGKVVIDVAGKALYGFTTFGTTAYDGYHLALSEDESDLGSYFFDHGYVRVRRKTVLRYNVSSAYSDEDILIDEEGNHFPIPSGYVLKGYSDGVLLLEKDGKYGYMDIHGAWILQPIYPYASAFYGGLAVVKMGEKYGMIDKTGQMAIPFDYTHLSHSSFGTILAYSSEAGWEMLTVMKPTDKTEEQ